MPISGTNGSSEHDPLPRQLDEEPHLALLARDWRAPHVCRIYAAIREGRWAHAKEILAAMEGRAGAHAREPHKDSQHAWSARKVAGQMEQWFIHNREAPGARNRVNTGPEEPEAQ